MLNAKSRPRVGLVRVVAAAVLTTGLAAPVAVGQTTTVVASTGQAVPGGVGVFSSFSGPALNDAGQAAFFGTIAGSGVTSANDRGVFRGDGGATVQIARGGQAAPGGVGVFSTFGNPALNDAGQAAFTGFFTGNGVTTANDRGIFRGAGGATLQIARAGQAAPDGVGVFTNFLSPALNDAGQTAFLGFLTGGGVSTANDRGIFRGNGGATVQIARTGQGAPDGVGVFADLGNPALNGAGQAAFFGALSGGGITSANDRGIFRGDGLDTLQIAREGRAAPGGVGVFSSFGNPALNDAGQAAFFGILTGSGVTSANDRGIFRGDGGATVQIARAGQAAPGGVGVFSIFGDPIVNDAGQAAFVAFLTGGGVTSANDRGIFRGDGGTTSQIARSGQAAPGGVGVFMGFDTPTLNDAEQAAFVGFLTGTGVTAANDVGLYFYDDALGLLNVAREGDAFLGSTITGLTFRDNATLGDEGNGLNNRGQVAYQYTLADGRSGVAVFSVPEPASLGVLALGAMGLLRRRRE